MKDLFDVNSYEFNYQYDDQIYFPYRISSLVVRVDWIRNKIKFNDYNGKFER